MLIVFGGLPGVGKTTIARAVAGALPAVYLRVDAIEQAIRDAGGLADEVGTAGYGVAGALAESNLAIGQSVVVDCVNPVRESRAAWREIAARVGVGLVEVEVVCSDAAEHRRRVEGRVSDIAGLRLPSWAEVMGRYYEAWEEPHVLVDSSLIGVEAAVERVMRAGWSSGKYLTRSPVR